MRKARRPGRDPRPFGNGAGDPQSERDPLSSEDRKIPRRAVAISALALLVPVWTVAFVPALGLPGVARGGGGARGGDGGVVRAAGAGAGEPAAGQRVDPVDRAAGGVRGDRAGRGVVVGGAAQGGGARGAARAHG